MESEKEKWKQSIMFRKFSALKLNIFFGLRFFGGIFGLKKNEIFETGTFWSSVVTSIIQKSPLISNHSCNFLSRRMAQRCVQLPGLVVFWQLFLCWFIRIILRYRQTKPFKYFTSIHTQSETNEKPKTIRIKWQKRSLKVSMYIIHESFRFLHGWNRNFLFLRDHLSLWKYNGDGAIQFCVFFLFK